MHLNRNTRNILAGDVMEILQESQSECRYLPIPSDVLLTILKSGLTAEWTDITVEDYDDTRNALKTSIVIGDITQRVFAHSSFGPIEAKKLSIVLVEGTHMKFWF